MKHLPYGHTHAQQANAHMPTRFFFNKHVNAHSSTNKCSHMHALPRPEGHADLSLCHKLPSPCQQAPHRFTLHHLGESESRRTQREGLRRSVHKRRRRGGRQTDGETDGGRNAGRNDKSKERSRSDVEAG